MAVYTRGRPRPSPYLTVASMRDAVTLPLQKLLFSATLSHDPEQLEQLNLFEPKLFRCIVAPKDIVGGITGKPGEFALPRELTQQYVTSSTQDRWGGISNWAEINDISTQAAHGVAADAQIKASTSPRVHTQHRECAQVAKYFLNANHCVQQASTAAQESWPRHWGTAQSCKAKEKGAGSLTSISITQFSARFSINLNRERSS